MTPRVHHAEAAIAQDRPTGFMGRDSTYYIEYIANSLSHCPYHSWASCLDARPAMTGSVPRQAEMSHAWTIRIRRSRSSWFMTPK